MGKSYQILSYSYVRRHYIKFQHDAEMSLYEHQQGLLEGNTDKLMEKYESLRKRYDMKDTSNGNIQADLVEIHQLTKTLQAFRDNMLNSFATNRQD